SPENRGSARTGRRPSGAVFGGYGIDSCCQANPDRKDCQGCLDSEAVWPLLVTRPHQTEGFGYGPTMPLTPPPSSRPWQNRVKKHALKLQGRFDRNRRGLSWGVLLAGALAAAVALWPLAATVWDLLGLTSAQTWRLAAAGIGAVLLAAGVAGLTHKPAPEQASSHSKRSPVRLFWLILAAWTVAASVVAAMTGL